jgi:DNA-binding SARP family transcriptional activator
MYAPAKISRPISRDVLQRDRLFARLDSALGAAPVVWATGPGGSGKTTLVTGYLDARELSCIWYRFDGREHDPAAFFHFMGLAAAHAFPNAPTQLPHLTPEYLQGIDVFTMHFFEQLYGMCAPLSGSFIFVFDDYQSVQEFAVINGIMKAALRAIPEGIKVVVTSRAEPPREFMRMRANRKMQLVGWEDLRFTREDVAGLIELECLLKPSDEVVEKLLRRTEGWVAALVLLMERHKSSCLKLLEDGGLTDDDFKGGATPGVKGGATPGVNDGIRDNIFDYFQSEIFERTDADTRDFLLKTALLDEMTVEMAEELTGNVRSGAILETLFANNSFIEWHTGESIYRYHMLFREFLLSRVAAAFGEDLPGLKIKAGKILERAGRRAECVRLYTEAAAWEELTAFVVGQAPWITANGGAASLKSWINGFPADVMEKNPRLLYWMGVCVIKANPAESRVYFERAYALFKASGGTPDMLATWCFIVDTFIYEWKDFKPLDIWINEFYDHLKPLGFPSVEIEERVVASMFGALMFRRADHPEIKLWEARAVEIGYNSADYSRRMFVGYSLILYNLWMGNIPKAGVLVDNLSKFLETVKDNPLLKLIWIKAAGLYNAYTNHNDTVFSLVDEGLKISDETGIHGMDVQLWGLGIYSSLLVGDVERGEEFLNRIYEKMDGVKKYDVMYYNHMSSLVAVHHNNFNKAIEQAELAVKITRESGASLVLIPVLSMLITVYIETGMFGDHYMLFNELQEIENVTGSVTAVYWACINKAFLALRTNNDEEFAVNFAAAIRVAGQNGIRYMLPLKRSNTRMCMKALELGIETEYVKSLIRQMGLTPDTSLGKVVEDWPYPIRIFTLGRFDIHRDEKPVKVQGKVQKMPLALLKALVALGATDVSADRISDSLWPDADGDMAKRSLNTTLHRLRRLVDCDEAFILKDGTLSINTKYCRLDTADFNASYTELSGLLDDRRAVGDENKRSGNDSIALAFKKISDIYTGEFLPGDASESWAVAARESFKARYVRLCDRVGGLYESEGRTGDAVECYRRAIDVDSLQENFYRKIIDCYISMGMRAEAITVYNNCKKVIESVFGIEVSSETQDAYNKLMESA